MLRFSFDELDVVYQNEGQEGREVIDKFLEESNTSLILRQEPRKDSIEVERLGSGRHKGERYHFLRTSGLENEVEGVSLEDSEVEPICFRPEFGIFQEKIEGEVYDVRVHYDGK